jgi:DNA polymerase III sliding clamp (beta) subunit (PCNA family)
LEQVNIVGKRSGDGFVAHKEQLVDALARAQAERVMLFNDEITLGRRGFLAYLKALAGSNIVKVVPASDNASGSQVVAKGVKVVCGNHQGYLPNEAWIKDKMPLTFNEVRVSPSNAVVPNLGSVELAEALLKVVGFASIEEAKAVLQTVRFHQKEGKLTLTASDGFRLAEVSLDFEAGEAEALIYASELKGLISALRKAKRVKVSFEQKADEEGGLVTKLLLIDTELIRYKFHSQDGEYPDYEKVIPGEFVATASFDTKAMMKASQSLLSFWYDDDTKPLYRPLTLAISEGKVTIEAKEDRGKAVIEAEASGEGKVAVNGKYLLQALRTCGGIAEVKIVNASSPILFSSNGYRCLVMPMLLPGETEAPKAEAKAEAEPKTKRTKGKKSKAVAEAEAIAEAEADAKADAEAEPKRKQSRRAKVAVA